MKEPAGVRIERLEAPSAEDRDAILAIEAAAFSTRWTPESFASMLASPASRLYVARLSGDGRIAGYCAAYQFGDELHINSIAVEGADRRRGIGSSLVTTAIDRTGVRRATLEVRESNAAARAMYERLGFRLAAIRQRYYDNPEEDGLILWWIHEIG